MWKDRLCNKEIKVIDLNLSCSILSRFLVEMMQFIDIERIGVWGKGKVVTRP